jgi:hypothetical protein
MQGQMNTTKPKLLPVSVPWSISPSTPFLTLRAAESDPEHPTEVTAAAQFGLEQQQQNAQGSGPSRSVKIVQPPRSDEGTTATLQAATGGLYQLIRITFEVGAWARFYGSYSDTQVVEEAAFDWSALAHLNEHWKAGVEAYRRNYWSLWHQTGICPNPNMYEVEGSTWLREVNVRNPAFKHYLIVGHDAYVEVIAKGWRWESVRSLPGY